MHGISTGNLIHSRILDLDLNIYLMKQSPNAMYRKWLSTISQDDEAAPKHFRKCRAFTKLSSRARFANTFFDRFVNRHTESMERPYSM